MSQIVEVLKRDNPLVRDFVMACEQWSEEGVQDGRLVISAKERPVGEHERRYNLQVDSFFIYQQELFQPSHRSAPTK